MDLQNARAIVTGGASGIGAACVTRLREAAARVEILDLHVTPPTDVADEQQVVAGVARAVGALGGLDVAVLSAGVGGSAPLLALTTAEWGGVMNVNLRGAFVCLREGARAMRDCGAARAIVTITSVSG